jgi:HK97 family phage major capsid protein
MNRKQMQERLDAIQAEMAALVNMDDLTAEEEKKFDDLDAEFNSIEARLKRMDRVAANEQALRGSAGRFTSPGQPSDGSHQGQGDGRVEITHEYAFDSDGHFLQAVRAMADPASCPQKTAERMMNYQSELRAATGISEGSPSEGGFLVGTDMQRTIRQRMFEVGKLTGRCESQPIGPNSNALSYPKLKESSRKDGSRQGGIQVYMTGEAASLTKTNAEFEPGRMLLDKMTAYVVATDELLQDAVALNGWYRREVPRAMAFKADQQIYAGSGAGQFIGVLNSSAYVTVSKEQGQDANTIVAQNIMKMYARHLNPTNAQWYINQDCWPQIFNLSISVGTGGAPLFIPPGNIPDAPSGTLFGRPIVPLEQCKSLGNLGDICFGDFSQYMLIEKGGIRSDSSIHVAFDTGETAFRWQYRINGQPTYNNTVTPYEGSNTLGDFIVLEAR